MANAHLVYTWPGFPNTRYKISDKNKHHISVNSLMRKFYINTRSKCFHIPIELYQQISTPKLRKCGLEYSHT